MRTPAGSECKFFYGDYFRGRHHEECRLLKASIPPQTWAPSLCATCPVPRILQANSCEYMRLTGRVVRPLISAFQRRVQVMAYCEKSNQVVNQPEVGCGQCHPLPPIFEVRE